MHSMNKVWALLIVTFVGCGTGRNLFNTDADLNFVVEDYVALDGEEFIAISSFINQIDSCLSVNPELLQASYNSESKELSSESRIRRVTQRAILLEEVVNMNDDIIIKYKMAINVHGDVVLVRIEDITGEIDDHLARKSAINMFNMKFTKYSEDDCLSFGTYEVKLIFE